ncbi:efflux RND transporter periplasmic adaptor subunit [Pararoseomonas indoligenes]|uniref:Efflux RND transporter periplasmic adaptor subunit n=1 Tax=Roseomonas indoligenes TaxID=2820811 RepID=A0A940N2Z2_9PROT|nr:efflux RND transporter periplasmic adaptor subunit [Pararoseomonas indoligenes]MBP0493252.1 efflux RND transporter periplasmic adaptor subunit [Pararoseomonas indoligenes]
MKMMTPPQIAEVASQSAAAQVEAPVAPRRRLPLLLAGIAVLAVGGGYAWKEFGGHQAPAVISPAQAASNVGRQADGSFRITPTEAKLLRVEPVAARAFRPERVAEGRIAFNEERSTPVFSPYTGRVVRAVAQPGQQVQAGDVLFEIETTDLTQAANDLLSALDAGGKSRTAVDLARRNEARQRDLFAAKAAARRDVEQSQADLANAISDQRTAEATLAAARDKLRVLGRTPEQIAEIERTRRVNAVVAVTAPLAGTVVFRRIGPNQWLNAGNSDPIYTIADLSQMWLVAGVREMDAPMVRPGQNVQVTVDALPGQAFSARIANVANSLDPTTRRLTVRAAVEDPDHLLKPEMFASFRIAVGEAKDAVAVPAGALIYRGANTSLWEALGDDRFIMRSVRTGMQSDGMVQITDGLNPGARIVTGGALFIDRAAQD